MNMSYKVQGMGAIPVNDELEEHKVYMEIKDKVCDQISKLMLNCEMDKPYIVRFRLSKEYVDEKTRMLIMEGELE